MGEAGLVLEEPGAGGVSEAGDFGGGEGEEVLDGGLEGGGIDPEVLAEVAWLAAVGGDEDAAVRGDEFVHGGGIGGEDGGAAGHGLDDVVAPAF